MKKLILSSAAIILFAVTVSATVTTKSSKKAEKNCSPKECTKGGGMENCKPASCKTEDPKCKDEKSCSKTTAKPEVKKVDL